MFSAIVHELKPTLHDHEEQIAVQTVFFPLSPAVQYRSKVIALRYTSTLLNNHIAQPLPAYLASTTSPSPISHTHQMTPRNNLPAPLIKQNKLRPPPLIPNNKSESNLQPTPTPPIPTSPHPPPAPNRVTVPCVYTYGSAPRGVLSSPPTMCSSLSSRAARTH